MVCARLNLRTNQGTANCPPCVWPDRVKSTFAAADRGNMLGSWAKSTVAVLQGRSLSAASKSSRPLQLSSTPAKKIFSPDLCRITPWFASTVTPQRCNAGPTPVVPK